MNLMIADAGIIEIGWGSHASLFFSVRVSVAWFLSPKREVIKDHDEVTPLCFSFPYLKINSKKKINGLVPKELS